MKQITIDNFKDKVIDNKKPVILEFHGSFCAACVNVEKELNEAEALYAKQIFFAYVDADKEEMINTALQVYELPAVFFFYKGHVYDRHNGFLPAEKLKEQIHQLLKVSGQIETCPQ